MEMRSVVRFVFNLNLLVWTSIAAAIVSTYLCINNELYWNGQISMLVTPIVFPLAFSINESYRRRERVRCSSLSSSQPPLATQRIIPLTRTSTVLVFRQKITLEDAIGSHACSLEANMRVANGIPLGCALLLPVDTVNSVQTRKVLASYSEFFAAASAIFWMHRDWESDSGTVRVFRQRLTLEDAVGSHACSLEASMHATNGIPLGWPLFLLVHTVNCVQTLKVCLRWHLITLGMFCNTCERSLRQLSSLHSGSLTNPNQLNCKVLCTGCCRDLHKQTTRCEWQINGVIRVG
jgi:hypothetical protein